MSILFAFTESFFNQLFNFYLLHQKSTYMNFIEIEVKMLRSQALLMIYNNISTFKNSKIHFPIPLLSQKKFIENFHSIKN